jgi:transposase
MLTDTQWTRLEPLIEACRPQGKTPPQDLRRTLSAILWRHQNGAKWRAIPADLGPWSRAAQTFIRWVRLGVAGCAWACGSACCSWPKSAGSNSG